MSERITSNSRQRAFPGFSGLAFVMLSGLMHAQYAVATEIRYQANHFEISYDSNAQSLLGSPTSAGNAFSFSPVNFFAQQTTPGVDFKRATFNLQVRVDPGYSVTGIRFQQRGDYFAMGQGANVNALGQLRVFDLERPLTHQLTEALISNDSFSSRNSAATINWSNQAFVDLRNPQWKGSDSLSITIESLLMGYNLNGGLLSFIENKFAGLQIDVMPSSIAPVPEPAHWASLLAGLGLVGFLVRRRKQITRAR